MTPREGERNNSDNGFPGMSFPVGVNEMYDRNESPPPRRPRRTPPVGPPVPTPALPPPAPSSSLPPRAIRPPPQLYATTNIPEQQQNRRNTRVNNASVMVHRQSSRSDRQQHNAIGGDSKNNISKPLHEERGEHDQWNDDVLVQKRIPIDGVSRSRNSSVGDGRRHTSPNISSDMESSNVSVELRRRNLGVGGGEGLIGSSLHSTSSVEHSGSNGGVWPGSMQQVEGGDASSVRRGSVEGSSICSETSFSFPTAAGSHAGFVDLDVESAISERNKSRQSSSYSSIGKKYYTTKSTNNAAAAAAKREIPSRYFLGKAFAAASAGKGGGRNNVSTYTGTSPRQRKAQTVNSDRNRKKSSSALTDLLPPRRSLSNFTPSFLLSSSITSNHQVVHQRMGLSTHHHSRAGGGGIAGGTTEMGNIRIGAEARKVMSRWKLCLIVQLFAAIPLVLYAFDAHKQKRSAHARLEEYETEQQDILKQMHWLDKTAKRITEVKNEVNFVGVGSSIIGASTEGRVRLDSSTRDAGGHETTEELQNNVKLLRGQVRDMQWRIQQNSRALIVDRFGQDPVKVYVHPQPPSRDVTNIVIQLWDSTPHAAWTWLDQIERDEWNDVQMNWSSETTITSELTMGRVRERLEFLEQAAATTTMMDATANPRNSPDSRPSSSSSNTPFCEVSLSQSATGALSLRINLADGPFSSENDVCVGRVVNDSLLLPRTESFFRARLTT